MVSRNRIQIVKGDITLESVDAIVNAANTDLILGGGVAGAIRLKGGPAVQEECDVHGPVELGEAALTTAGNLVANHVIHAAVMHLGSRPDAESIKNATLNALKIAERQKLGTISFPALGTGIGGFPLPEAASIMISTVSHFVRKNAYPQIVRLVLYDENSYSAFKQELERL